MVNNANQANIEFDIAIIGGGPSGTICALSLIKLNPTLKICIVEKDKFPRDKACGGGLSPGVYKILSDLDLQSILHNKEPIENLTISSPNGFELNTKLPKMGNKSPRGYVIPRTEFDNKLYNKVIKEGLTVFNEYELISYIDKKRFLTEITIKRSEELIKFNTRLLIGADGARSKVRRLLDIPFNEDSQTGVAMRFYCEIEGSNETSLRFDFLENINPGYGWIFPLDNKYANVGVGIDISKLRKRNMNLDKMFEQYINFLQGKIKIKVIQDTKMSYILPYGTQLPKLVNNSNKVLIGDAASMINPYTGEGIYYGMYAGNLLAKHLHNKLNDELYMTKALNSFEIDFRRQFVRHYKINNFIKHLMNSKFANLIIKSYQDPRLLKETIELIMGDKRNLSIIYLLKIISKSIF